MRYVTRTPDYPIPNSEPLIPKSQGGVEMSEQRKSRLGRREFLGAAAAASFTILKPQFVRGTTANSQVRFGILGCGGRGTAVGFKLRGECGCAGDRHRRSLCRPTG